MGFGQLGSMGRGFGRLGAGGRSSTPAARQSIVFSQFAPVLVNETTIRQSPVQATLVNEESR